MMSLLTRTRSELINMLLYDCSFFCLIYRNNHVHKEKNPVAHAMYCDSYFCNFITCFLKKILLKNLFASTVSCITIIGAFFFSVKLNVKCSFEVTSYISKIFLLKILFRDTKFVPSHILQKEKMVIRSLQRPKFW